MALSFGSVPTLNTSHRLTLLQLALRRYELAHGGLPERLEDLVPQFLPAVPLDPFDHADGSIRWIREKALIYSVGLNYKDDGGDIKVSPDKSGSDEGMRYWWAK